MTFQSTTKLALLCLGLLAPCLASTQDKSPAAAYEPLESDLREAYTFNLLFTEPFTYEVAHIMAADEKTAVELWHRLLADEDWATVAAKYSSDTASGAKGGSLGWRPAGDFVEPFASTMRELKLGSFSKPIHTSYGWSIVKITNRRRNIPEPFDKARERLVGQVKKQMEGVEARKGDPAALNAEMASLLHSAPVLRRMLALGADPSARNTAGMSALHKACIWGAIAEADLLVKAGAQLDGADSRGKTPLHYAATGDKTGILTAMLLRKGVPAIGTEEGNGLAPIHLAAAADNAEGVRALVKAGESPNRPAREGRTPLMCAAGSQAPRALAALLALGADPLVRWSDEKAKYKANQTALDMLVLTPDTANERDAETLLWKATLDAALRRHSGTFKAFIVQDGKRAQAGAGPVTLKRRPFTLEFETQGASGVTVVAQDLGRAGSDPGVLSARLKGQLEHTLRTFAESDGDLTLFLQSPDDPNPGDQTWMDRDAVHRFTTFEKTTAGFNATRRVESLFDLPSGLPPSSPYKGRTLRLAPGENLPPLLLTLAITEEVGMFEQAVSQMLRTEVRWSDR